MVVCVECLPADKPWDVVSVTRRSSGVAPRACVRVYARVLVPPNLYIHTYQISLHSHTRARRSHTSQHLHRGHQTLRHEVTQVWGAVTAAYTTRHGEHSPTARQPRD